MADLSYGSNYSASAPNMEDDDDEFERNLKQMLKDGNIGNTTTSGAGGYKQDTNYGSRGLDLGTGTPRGSANNSQNTVPRSYTSPTVSATATTDIPLSSPGQRSAFSSPSSPHAPGGPLGPSQPMAARIENIKEWSVNTFKCTRQFIAEKLGKGSRTVDVELEAQIERLRDTQRKYAQVLRLARALTSHFTNVVATQRQLGDAFGELAQKSPELMEEFSYNSETQKVLSRNGETLLGALNFFTSSVNTLCNKTMEDTILTIKNYEISRLEFDAYKQDYEAVKALPKDGAAMAKVNDAQLKFDQHRQKFEKLREDVSIKLKFLEENKVKVMHKQLLLFHNAISAYFSGNQSALESTLKQFNIKLLPPTKTSWLEN